MKLVRKLILLSRALSSAPAAFSPLDISVLTAWYDVSDITTLWKDSARTTPVTADGDVIGAIDDKSGNGRHLTQATTAFKPIYKAAIQNGLSIARFADTSARIELSIAYGDLYTLTASANAATIITVMKQAAGAGTNSHFVHGTDGANRVMTHATYLDVIYFDFGNNSAGGRINVAQPAGWDDAYHTLILRRSAGDGTIRVDGSDLLNGSFTDDLGAATETLSLGGASISGFASGEIGEFLIYNTAVTGANLTALEGYLDTRWGL